MATAPISNFRSLSSCSFTLLPTVRCNSSVKFGAPSRKRMRSMMASACFHLVDGLLLDEAAELVVLPVLAHLGVEEVLVDGGQFFGSAREFDGTRILGCFLE